MTTDTTAPAAPTVTTNPDGSITISTPIMRKHPAIPPRTLWPCAPLSDDQAAAVSYLVHQVAMQKSALARIKELARWDSPEEMKASAAADYDAARDAVVAVAALLGIIL